MRRAALALLLLAALAAPAWAQDDPLGLGPEIEALVRSRAPQPVARIELPALGDFGFTPAERGALDVRLSMHTRARVEGAVPVTVVFEEAGRELRRVTVTARVVLAKPAVKRGQLVTLRLARGSLQIFARGKAREDGRTGDTIRVQNVDSRREVVGVVAGDGVVDVAL